MPKDDITAPATRPKLFKWWPFKKRRTDRNADDPNPFTPLSAGGPLSDTAPWSAPPEPTGRSQRPAVAKQDPSLDATSAQTSTSKRPSYTPRYAARDALLSIPSAPDHLPRRVASARNLHDGWQNGAGPFGPATVGFSYTGKGKSRMAYEPNMMGPWEQSGSALSYSYHHSSLEARRKAPRHTRSFSTEPNGKDVPAVPTLPDLALMSGALAPPPKPSRNLNRASIFTQQGESQADIAAMWEMAGFVAGDPINEEDLEVPPPPPLPPLPEIESRDFAVDERRGGGRGRRVRASRSLGTLAMPTVSRAKPPSRQVIRTMTAEKWPEQETQEGEGAIAPTENAGHTPIDFSPRASLPPEAEKPGSPISQLEFGPAPAPPPTTALPDVPDAENSPPTPPTASENSSAKSSSGDVSPTSTGTVRKWVPARPPRPKRSDELFPTPPRSDACGSGDEKGKDGDDKRGEGRGEQGAKEAKKDSGAGGWI